ncbi:MAG: chromosome segregation protein SMC, partial [Halanaerobium sp.]|nr:chromosome segregation protein SMC [Halanaerobium sp.]
MILKQLKIKGFKSFPDPVVINFEPDITAIVGPNGSGKSNIVDAIRWALGEQSAKLLRGSRMEDLIFSGSSTRKALDSAEVFLTLDNSDNTLPVEQKEITIGRRVANSGESDYIMNKQVCRLKDIQELIMDTGIGKEAYSIIGQGKIDYLLSSRPQDRREIFEEAAGVMKYKQRKREASRKLERTQQDLVRLEDIIGELENRLKPVAREAKKAKEYEELYARLKELEVAEAGVRWDHLVAEQADYQEELAGIKKSLQLKEKELDEKEGLVQRLEEKKDGLLDRLEEQKELVFKIKTDREQYKNRIEIYKERKENSRQNLDRLEDEQKREQSVLLDNESKIAENRVEQHDSQDKLLALQDEIDQVSRKMAAIQEEIDARNNEKEAINSSLVDYLNEKAEIKNRLALNREKSKDISSEIEEVEEERNQLAAKLDLIMDEEDRVREKLINLREAELQLSRDRDKLESSLSNLQKELEQIEQELQKKKESIQHLDSSLKLLQRLEDQKEGYYRGVKRVLLARDQGHLEDIYGVIAELIEVDARYEQAIAAVLGGRLQNVVVENSEAAKEAIDFLRHNQCGRATFMPLDLIQERSLSTKEKAVLAEEGILGTATDFIEFAPYLAPAVSNLLGRVIVAEDKEAALKAFRSVQGSLLFVTLAGETVNPGGTMTGGSINEKQLDLLTRSRQIEDMREQVEQARQEYAGLADKREEFLASLEKKKQRLEEITRALRQNEMEVLSQQKDLEGLKGESNRLRQEISSLDDRFARFYDKLGALDVESKNLAQELNLIGSDNEEQEELLQQLAVEIEKLKENKEALNEEIVQMRME